MLNKIELSNDGVTFSLASSEFALELDTTAFVSSKSYIEINTPYYSKASEINDFTPVELSFSAVNIDYGVFRSFLRKYNTEFFMTVTYNNSKYWVLCSFLSDEILQLGYSNYERYSFSIITRSMFVKMKTYRLTTNDDTISNGYDYDYDFTYSDKENTYLYSQLEVFDYGEKPAPIKIQINGVSNEFAVGVNALPKDTHNSYISQGIDLIASEYLINNSFPPFRKIEKTLAAGSKLNVEQNREFLNSKGYLHLEKQVNNLIFINCASVEVTVYESYYNLA